MLNNFIGGGQIFLHKITMFLQVLGRSVKVSLMVGMVFGISFNYANLSKMDSHVIKTIIKAHTLQCFDSVVNTMRVAAGKTMIESRINVRTNSGIRGKNVYVSNVLSNQKLNSIWATQKAMLKKTLEHVMYGFSCVFVLIFLLWDKFGGNMKNKTHLKGNIVQNRWQVARYLNRNKKNSSIIVGGIPLVRDSQTRHILVTGSTGSGKTNCLHEILSQIRKEKQPAIVIDTEGCMIQRYYRPGIDIIINPFDARSHGWDLFLEIKTIADIKDIANSFFPDSPADLAEYDKKWIQWGKILFIGILEYLVQKEECSMQSLYHLIHKAPLEELIQILQDTSAANILSKNEANTAVHNIRINTMIGTEWLEHMENSGPKFAFRDWFNKLDLTNTDQWIFLASYGKRTKTLTPMLSTLSDIALNSLIDQGEDINRRIWFVFDELAKLKYLPTLSENITLLRKYGGCVLAATQSFNQIFSHYGRLTGSVMLGQFGTNVIFRITQTDEATILAKRIGEIEYMMHQKNVSYGAHEMRDGISYQQIEKIKPLVNIHDLVNLEVFECFLLLPDPQVAISRTKLKLHAATKMLQPAFCPLADTQSGINTNKLLQNKH